MNQSFSQKFPATASLIKLIAGAMKDTVAALQPGESLLEKLSGYANLGPAMITFLPQSGSLSAEYAALSLSDDVSAVEMLVTELSFSNDHAQKVIAAMFPVVEGVVAMEPKVKVLVDAING